MESNFVWIDLSTFDVQKATDFYRDVLGWSYATDGSGYTQCEVNGAPCAGLYEMPDFFQKIRMPSFWMTYVSVSDVE
ncbi:MAG: VOC family protein [Acidobacteriota bacterium]